jgi:hypothetical protein
MTSDLSVIYFLALVGLLAAAIVAIGGGGWLAYHLIAALSLYLGS